MSPFDLGNHPPSDTLRLLSRYFDRLCQINTPDSESSDGNAVLKADPVLHNTPFHARSAPNIDLNAYLSRILKYCPCANEVFLAIAVYAKMLEEKHGMVIDKFNVHRICITGVVVASKFYSDVFFTNSRYAKVGGLPVSELNALEIRFMELLEYKMYIHPHDLQDIADFLWQYRPRPQSIVIPPVDYPPSEPPTPTLPVDIAHMAWRPQVETPVSANHPQFPVMFAPNQRPSSTGGMPNVRRTSDVSGGWSFVQQQQQQQAALLQQRRQRATHQRATSYHPSLGTQVPGQNPMMVPAAAYAVQQWGPMHRWSGSEDYFNGRVVSPDAPRSRHRSTLSTTGSGYYTPPHSVQTVPTNTADPMHYNQAVQNATARPHPHQQQQQRTRSFNYHKKSVSPPTATTQSPRSTQSPSSLRYSNAELAEAAAYASRISTSSPQSIASMDAKQDSSRREQTATY